MTRPNVVGSNSFLTKSEINCIDRLIFCEVRKTFAFEN